MALFNLNKMNNDLNNKIDENINKINDDLTNKIDEDINKMNNDLTNKIDEDINKIDEDINKINEKTDNFVMNNNKILIQNSNRSESIDLFSRLKSMEVYDEYGNLLN